MIVSTPTPVTGVQLSMWRAAVAFRVVTAPVCVYLVIRWRDLYARPALAWGVAAAIVVVTVVVAGFGWRGRGQRPWLLAGDVVVTAVLTLATIPAQTRSQRHGQMPTLTTIWAAGPTLELAIAFGGLAGLATALAYSGVAFVVRAGYDGRTLTSVVILVVAATLTGYVGRLAVRAEADVAAAAAERAALAERERLARSIHDGVLQVLGLVHRTGREAGGRWAELAREAAAQETAVRALITSRPAGASLPSAGAGTLDLGARLRQLRGERVSVATPGEPVELPAHVAGELADATGAALDNVGQHAGPGAHAWVLLEREDDAVVITVRDDGPGFAAGRLEQAAGEGRLGVRSSIAGRLAGLGGRAEISSRPGDGTTVVLRLPWAGPA